MSSPTNNFADSHTEPLSRLEIHLDRIRRNYLTLQKTVKKGTDVAAVVKADAYGLGVAAIVPELYKATCRHFYVAYFKDALTVREALAGEQAHVYLLNGPYGEDPAEFTRHGMIPILNTYGDIEYWSSYAKKTGKKQPALIQIDTGMNRLGLTGPEVEKLKSNLDVLKPIDLRYVMSHLACADEPDHSKNREQLEKFKNLTGYLGLPSPLSLANSGGIFLGPDYHFDQVRSGCAIYGINPQHKQLNPMQGTITLSTRILQTRDAAPGETVGYAASYRVAKPAKLATISVGYADGIFRSFASGGAVYIRGQKCPVVGRVSMELITVDVSDVPNVQAGDWAELIGEHQTVDDVADEAKTIGYEILTSLRHRYKRVYSGRE